MGGQTFPNVNVPRMPSDLYQRISADVKSKLETLFKRVTVPREGPGKLDHGDIDFLVEGLQSTNEAEIWSVIQTLLGTDLYQSRGDSHASYGIPHPDIPNAYVQVDVELCPGNDTSDGAELFEWTKFMKGDSDMTQIIGILHRPLGLTCNDRGLHFSVEEIRPYNKKKSLLFLTRDPQKALEFYGLDRTKYRAGFQDEADLFEWISKGRFFAWEVFEHRVEKSNDRQRHTKRDMFRRFVDDYMPAHQDAGKENSWTRQQVLEEALTVFNKRNQYDAMMAVHNEKEAEEALWKQIKESLPVGANSMATVLKSLRRWVDFKDGQPFITASCLEETPLWSRVVTAESTQATLDWVAANWALAKTLEAKRAKEAKEAAQNGVLHVGILSALQNGPVLQEKSGV
jgi:hypothetical protein